jgi:hypothetical protein
MSRGVARRRKRRGRREESGQKGERRELEDCSGANVLSLSTFKKYLKGATAAPK